MLIDTHCHLDDDSFADRTCEVLAAARRVGVEIVIMPGVHPAGWERMAALASKSDGVWPAFGVHPMHAADCSDEALRQLAIFADAGVAIGEIGLDYTLDGVSRDCQAAAFRAQLRLAVDRGLPVLIHCRKAFRDLLEILRGERGVAVGGIMHAFSGSVETAQELVQHGFLISVAGPVTYANAVRGPAVVRALPLEVLVLETDAPDLAPEPHRGAPNEPANLPLIASRVAELKGVSLVEVARITSANARRLLRLNGHGSPGSD